jgi:hypothetical protein
MTSETHVGRMNTGSSRHRRHLVLLGCGIAFLFAGCTIPRQLDDHVTAYTYSAFDFSGNAYSRARKACDAKAHKLIHKGTDCGFFLCTSTFDCSPE